jgi:hypothetical protein
LDHGAASDADPEHTGVRVDGRVPVNGSILDARHSCKFKNHVGVFATTIRHFHCLPVTASLLYQLYGSIYLLL